MECTIHELAGLSRQKARPDPVFCKRSMRADKIIVESADEIGKTVVDSTEKPGQLLRDLAIMYEKRSDPNFKIEWYFDKRSTGQAEVYLNAIKKELRNESGGGGILKNILGLDADDLPASAWQDALVELDDLLDDDFIQILSE